MVFTLQLDEKTLAEIGNMLAHHPYKQAAPIINLINQQVREQLQPQQKGGE